MKHYDSYSAKGSYAVDVNGIKFRMFFGGEKATHAIDERIAGVREAQTECLLKALVRPGDNVLEMGSCYGYFTLMLANLVGDGHVYACEPDKRYLRLLRENLRINATKNVTVHPVFVGSGVFDGEEELSRNRVTGAHAIENGCWPVDVVFMDIEGHEVFVIPELLSTGKRPRVLMFQPHVRLYRERDVVTAYEDMLNIMEEDYRVMRTQQMIVGLRK